MAASETSRHYATRLKGWEGQYEEKGLGDQCSLGQETEGSTQGHPWDRIREQRLRRSRSLTTEWEAGSQELEAPQPGMFSRNFSISIQLHVRILETFPLNSNSQECDPSLPMLPCSMESTLGESETLNEGVN